MSELKAIHGSVICAIDKDGKNWHTFSDGTKIRLERQWNNLDRSYTEPVNAIVIDAENIPRGSNILCHHNSTHPTYEIFNYKPLGGEEIADSVKYYSIPEHDCFVWENGDEWQPLEGFALALRVFEPIKTQFYGIAHKQFKDTLYIYTGEYRGKVCHTVKAADFAIKFQHKGQEKIVIRCRPNGDAKTKREREVIAINHELTEKVLSGECYVGLSVTDAKPIIKLERANTL